MPPVIVRFAPSPTGYLHIGGARTAIYNWLFARKHGGTFILRIEDTDAQRTTRDAIQGILDGMRWLGLDWDKGPYFQSEFVKDHVEAANCLVEKGLAYPCFCSKATLDQKRAEAQRQHRTYQYDGTCRQKDEAEVADLLNHDVPHTIRFKVPRKPGAVQFDDAVHGRIEKQYSDIEDFIIVRTNGQPLYVLSNAVDDIRDGVTHVIRGQDGLANTPKQVLLYQGLAAPLPQFVHMSLTLDPSKAKISKRKHGEQVAIHHYRDNGFLPWAVVNFLVLLGWATRDSRAYFSPEELIEAFSFEGMGQSNAVFNIGADDGKHFTDPKLLSMNAHYLRTMPMDDLLPHIKAEYEKAALWQHDFETTDKKWFYQAMDLIRARYHLLSDFVTFGRAYVDNHFPMDDAAVEKTLRKQIGASRWLSELANLFEQTVRFDPESVEKTLRQFMQDHRIKAGPLMGAIRTAVSGQSVGPDFIRMLVVLGKDTVVQRLRAAAPLCADNQ